MRRPTKAELAHIDIDQDVADVIDEVAEIIVTVNGGVDDYDRLLEMADDIGIRLIGGRG